MIVLSIALVIISIALGILEILSYKSMNRCLRKQQQGKVYVKLLTSSEHVGWMSIRDITSIRNNIKSYEEHVRIEENEEISLIQVGSIKEITTIDKTMLVLIGNL